MENFVFLCIALLWLVFGSIPLFGIKRFDLIIIANINRKFTFHLETLITTVSSEPVMYEAEIFVKFQLIRAKRGINLSRYNTNNYCHNKSC